MSTPSASSDPTHECPCGALIHEVAENIWLDEDGRRNCYPESDNATDAGAMHEPLETLCLTCNKPDRDVPRLTCGYPLPCPYHTIIMDLSHPLMGKLPDIEIALRGPLKGRSP